MVTTESTTVLDTGDEAPDFSLPGVDGESHSLADYRESDLVLLVFTCNHCPYARAKMPVLNGIAADYDDVAVVGVNPNDADEYPDDSFERMRELVDEGTVAYDDYLRDESQSVAAAYGATCTPDPFLLERREGGFRLAYHGRLDDAPNPDDTPERHEMRLVVDALLAGEPVPVEPSPSRGCSIKWKPGNEPDYWN